MRNRFKASAKRRNAWGKRLSFALCLGFWLGFYSLAGATKVLLVLSAENKIFQLIRNGIQEKLEAASEEVLLEETSGDAVSRLNPDLIVAIGNPAADWAKEEAFEIPVVVSGVILQSDEEDFSFPGVGLGFPLNEQIKTLQEFLPEAKTVGLILRQEMESYWIKAIRAAAAEFGIKILYETVESQRQVSKAAQLLKERGVGFLLMTYNPFIMNSETFSYLVGFSAENRIGLVVPSKALLKLGGLISIEPDYPELGRQTAALANQILNGSGSPGRRLQFPAQKEIGINLKVAGLTEVKFSEKAKMRASFIYR